MNEFIFLSILIGVFYFFLDAGNQEKKDRYKQGILPIIAFVYGLLCLLCFSYFLSPFSKLLIWLLRFIPISIVFNFELGLFVYLIATLLLYAFVRKKNKKFLKETVNMPIYGYLIDKQGKATLGKNWVYLKYFVKYLFVLAGIWSSSLIWGVVDSSVYLPYFTVYCILVIYELYYFLDIDAETAVPEKIIDAEEDNPLDIHDYEKLWTYYKTQFRAKLLSAQKVNQQFETVIKNRGNSFFQKQKDFQYEALSNAQRLSQEFPLSDNDYDLLQQLHQKKDVLIGNPIYQHHAVVILSVLINRLQLGEKILFLVPLKAINPSKDSNYREYKEDIKDWLEGWILKLNKNSNPFRIKNYSDVDKANYACNVLISTPDEMLESEARDAEWLFDLTTVVVFDAINIFVESNIKNQALFRLLYRHNQQLQSIVLSDYYNFLEPSVRNNTNPSSNLIEIKATPLVPSIKYLMLWKIEGDFSYQEYLFKGELTGKYLGEESMLTIPALSLEINNLFLVNQETAPIFEYLEEIRKEQSRIEIHKLPVVSLFSLASIKQNLSTQLFSQLHPTGDRQVLYVNDTKFNISTALEKWSSYTNDLVFLNVISQPYLLRDYFADNLHYFLSSPLYPIAPSLMKCRFSTAYLLLEELLAFEIEENEVLIPLRTINKNATNTKKELIVLFKECFCIDLSVGDDLMIAEKTVFIAGKYIKQNYYRLRRSLLNQVQFDFLDIVQIKESDNVISYISADHISQNYLLHQIHAFDGKQYKIVRYDTRQKVLFVEHTNTQKTLLYRPILEIELYELKDPLVISYVKKVRERMLLTLTEGNFNITTAGYYSYKHETQENSIFSGIELLSDDAISKRHYLLGRVLKIDIKLYEAEFENKSDLGGIFCLLLQEIFVSLFPEAFHYIVVCCPVNTLSTKYNQVEFHHKVLLKDYIPQKEVLEIFIFEDAYTDTGSLKAIYEKWEDILTILDDYLTWMHDESSFHEDNSIDGFILDSEYVINQVHDRKSYLKNIFDSSLIESAHILIRNMLGNTKNKLTIARTKKASCEQDGPTTNQIEHVGRYQCDFCGDFVAANEMFVLEPDKRERCPKCSETAVDSETELRKLYATALDYFKNELNIILTDDIRLHFTNATVIQRLRGEKFVASHRFDVRNIGLAVYKNNKYDIYIENGAPSDQTISTLVHEMTHIWQYRNLDMDKMRDDYGGLLVEGQAIWNEINFNPSQKEKLAPASRNDDYGNGYRLIKRWENKFKSNPFEFLSERYPVK